MSFANQNNQHHHFAISLSTRNQYLDPLTKIPEFLSPTPDKISLFTLLIYTQIDHAIKIKRNRNFCEGFPGHVFSTDYGVFRTMPKTHMTEPFVTIVKG